MHHHSPLAPSEAPAQVPVRGDRSPSSGKLEAGRGLGRASDDDATTAPVGKLDYAATSRGGSPYTSPALPQPPSQPQPQHSHPRPDGRRASTSFAAVRGSLRSSDNVVVISPDGPSSAPAELPQLHRRDDHIDTGTSTDAVPPLTAPYSPTNRPPSRRRSTMGICAEPRPSSRRNVSCLGHSCLDSSGTGAVNASDHVRLGAIEGICEDRAVEHVTPNPPYTSPTLYSGVNSVPLTLRLNRYGNSSNASASAAREGQAASPGAGEAIAVLASISANDNCSSSDVVVNSARCMPVPADKRVSLRTGGSDAVGLPKDTFVAVERGSCRRRRNGTFRLAVVSERLNTDGTPRRASRNMAPMLDTSTSGVLRSVESHPRPSRALEMTTCAGDELPHHQSPSGSGASTAGSVKPRNSELATLSAVPTATEVMRLTAGEATVGVHTPYSPLLNPPSEPISELCGGSPASPPGSPGTAGALCAVPRQRMPIATTTPPASELYQQGSGRRGSLTFGGGCRPLVIFAFDERHAMAHSITGRERYGGSSTDDSASPGAMQQCIFATSMSTSVAATPPQGSSIQQPTRRSITPRRNGVGPSPFQAPLHCDSISLPPSSTGDRPALFSSDQIVLPRPRPRSKAGAHAAGPVRVDSDGVGESAVRGSAERGGVAKPDADVDANLVRQPLRGNLRAKILGSEPLETEEDEARQRKRFFDRVMQARKGGTQAVGTAGVAPAPSEDTTQSPSKRRASEAKKGRRQRARQVSSGRIVDFAAAEKMGVGDEQPQLPLTRKVKFSVTVAVIEGGDGDPVRSSYTITYTTLNDGARDQSPRHGRPSSTGEDRGRLRSPPPTEGVLGEVGSSTTGNSPTHSRSGGASAKAGEPSPSKPSKTPDSSRSVSDTDAAKMAPRRTGQHGRTPTKAIEPVLMPVTATETGGNSDGCNVVCETPVREVTPQFAVSSPRRRIGGLSAAVTAASTGEERAREMSGSRTLDKGNAVASRAAPPVRVGQGHAISITPVQETHVQTKVPAAASAPQRSGAGRVSDAAAAKTPTRRRTTRQPAPESAPPTRTMAGGSALTSPITGGGSMSTRSSHPRTPADSGRGEESLRELSASLQAPRSPHSLPQPTRRQEQQKRLQRGPRPVPIEPFSALQCPGAVAGERVVLKTSSGRDSGAAQDSPPESIRTGGCEQSSQQRSGVRRSARPPALCATLPPAHREGDTGTCTTTGGSIHHRGVSADTAAEQSVSLPTRSGSRGGEPESRSPSFTVLPNIRQPPSRHQSQTTTPTVMSGSPR